MLGNIFSKTMQGPLVTCSIGDLFNFCIAVSMLDLRNTVGAASDILRQILGLALKDFFVQMIMF